MISHPGATDGMVGGMTSGGSSSTRGGMTPIPDAVFMGGSPSDVPPAGGMSDASKRLRESDAWDGTHLLVGPDDGVEDCEWDLAAVTEVSSPLPGPRVPPLAHYGNPVEVHSTRGTNAQMAAPRWH